MATARKHPSLPDMAAIALCPSLIVLLLASLVYFLVLCIYHGQYSGRIGYIWFMFIMGAVGIARLSIEQSRTYAATYALILGGATWFVLSRFMVVQGPLANLSFLINGGMIALVWVLADRITFDCTLIDEGEDASGQGLLDGFTNHDGDQDLVKSDQAAHASRRRRHQPGKTVLWLAAAALPIFGLGQWMLPQDERWQSSAIMALGGYLFATLSLLVATSFLGVRRYLRQRNVDMPANVTGAWLIGGIVMTIALLLVCFLLPQPGKMLANVQLPSAIDSPDWLKPSRYGWGGESAKPGSPSDAPGTGEAQPQDASQAPAGQNGKQPSGQIGAGPQGKQSGGQEQGASKTSSSDRSQSQQASPNQGQQARSQGQQAPDRETKAGQQTQSDQQNQSSQQTDSQQGQQSTSNRDQQSSAGKSEGQKQAGQSDRAQDDSTKPQAGSQQSNPTDTKQNDTKQNEAKQDDSQAQSPPPAAEPPQDNSPSWLSNLMPSLSGLFKAIIYVVLLGIIAVFVWLNRHELRAAWQRLLDWIAGRSRPEVASVPESFGTSAIESAPPKPFASFRNPMEQGVDPARAVLVTYQAAEAWWREQGHPRRRDETPSEYAKRLSTTLPREPAGKSNSTPAPSDPGATQTAIKAMQNLTDAYNRLLYGDRVIHAQDLGTVKLMWDSFTRRR